MNDHIQDVYNQRLTDRQFERLADFLYNGYGLKMPQSKKIMMESRLKPRLLVNQIATFSTYIEHLFSEEGRKKELTHMIDVLTTNKTNFFRENHHFQFLKKQFINQSLNTHYKIWSAGCSTGEEAYSIAVALTEAQQHHCFTFEIIGTDLSTRVLQTASKAVYPIDSHGLSYERKKAFFLKSKETNPPTIRVDKHLRNTVRFKQLNLVTPPYTNLTKHPFDCIFFRNVMIYFDRATQIKVLKTLCDKLKVGGYLFIGHSESITSLNLPLKQLQPTIFIKI